MADEAEAMDVEVQQEDTDKKNVQVSLAPRELYALSASLRLHIRG